ncbi:MAG: transglutaminase-like domain-containing protein, partial [Oscillospiraceae bacterium]
TSRSALLGGDLLCDLSGKPDGDCQLMLFHAGEQYNRHWSYLKVNLRLSAGELSFAVSPVLAHNQALYNATRCDKVALDYWRLPSTNIQSDHKDIAALSAELTAHCTTDMEKALAIHDWVANNIFYDFDAYRGTTGYGDTTALGTLQSRRSVCQGYASLTAALLRSAKIPAKLVAGYGLGLSTSGRWTAESAASSQTNHAWNEAWLDGRWVIIDTTWDSGNKWENGEKSDSSGLQDHTYFDATLEAFSNSHKLIRNGEESIPPILPPAKKTPDASVTATPGTTRLTLNGEAQTLCTYLIAQENYVKLRDGAALFSGTEKQFNVTWADGKVALTAHCEYTPVGGEKTFFTGGAKTALLNPKALIVDGRQEYPTAYLIENYNFVRLRDICALFDIFIDWDKTSNTVVLDTQ